MCHYPTWQWQTVANSNVFGNAAHECVPPFIAG